MFDPLCVLVLGTPRSGTSCTAGVVHHLGVSMGARLIPASHWNPAGFYQDLDFEEVLDAALGPGQWPNWTGFRHRTDPFAQQVEALASARRASGAPWGVKSNRLVHFLPSLIRGAGTNVRALITSRPVEESVASWAALTGYPDGHSFNPIRLMANAVTTVTSRVAFANVMTVDYPALVADPQTGVGAIASFLGVPVTQAAIDFVDAELRRVVNA